MPDLTLNGQYYRAGSSSCLPVAVCFEPLGLVVKHTAADEVYHNLPYSSVSISDKLGNTPRQIRFDNGDMVEVAHDAQLDLHMGRLKGHSERLGKLEGSRKMLLLSVVFAPLLLLGIFKYAVPAAANQVVSVLPDTVGNGIGEQYLAIMDKAILTPSMLPESQRQSIKDLWAEKLTTLKLDPARYHIRFRASEDIGANAFALPDGTIVFTDELVELMAQDDGLLFAILLHEIGHVEHRHSMRMMAESMATALILGYILGDFTEVSELFIGVSSTLLQNKFSREHEWQADNFALQQLAQINRSDSYAVAMEKLYQLSQGDDSPLAELFSSHPLMLERIENAKQQND